MHDHTVLKVTIRQQIDDKIGPFSCLLLKLVPQTLFMPVRLHAFAALVFGNFCFSSFFERAHSEFQICEWGFNHLIRCAAT
jgi:hypothetical protein